MTQYEGFERLHFDFDFAAAVQNAIYDEENNPMSFVEDFDSMRLSNEAPETTIPSTIPTPQSRTNRRNSKRAAKKAEAIRREGHVPTQSTVTNVIDTAEAIHLDDLDMESLPSNKGGYGGKVPHFTKKQAAEKSAYERENKRRRTPAELIAEGFRLVKWDGM